MADFDNNYNDQNNNQNGSNNGNTNGNNNGSYNGDDMNSQNQQQRVPNYNFWAEQAQGPNNSNYNADNNASSSVNYSADNNTNNNVNYNADNNASHNVNYNANNNANYNASNHAGNNAYSNANTWDNGYANQNFYGNNHQREQKRKEPSTGFKVFRFIVKAACFGLVAGLSFFGISRAIYLMNPDENTNILGNTSSSNNYEIGYTQTGTVKSVDNMTVSNVSKDTLPAIVSINSTTTGTTQWFGQNFNQEVEGSGSGIIVGKNDKELLIATNNHVVEGTDKITVTFSDGTEAAAEIKGTDAAADLAVVTVSISEVSKETLDVIEIAELGDSDEVKVGEMVIAIGNALGYGQSVTVGYISAKDREVQVSDGYESKTMVLLQTDAAINPGNSGGALFNVDGELIGINTVKYASNEVEGMGYAIPISRAMPIITDLMNRETLKEEEQGYLGITGSDVTEEISSFYNMPVGVYINEVSKDGAAEKAGLQANDIITVVDDRDITSITQLRDYVNSLRVGTEVEITYMRNLNGQYEEGKVTVTLGQNPSLTTNQ